MLPEQMLPQQLDAIADRAVLPSGREIDLPAHRSRSYVVIDGEVLLLGSPLDPQTERCGPGTLLHAQSGRLALRAVTDTVLGVIDGPGPASPVGQPIEDSNACASAKAVSRDSGREAPGAGPDSPSLSATRRMRSEN